LVRSELPDEPWRSFLSEIDRQLPVDLDAHCIGGFVVSQVYGLARETDDLDLIEVVPNREIQRLVELGGRDSKLARSYRAHIEFVGVATPPDGYASRLIRIFPSLLRLRLWALEAHDLALSKLERSADRDLQDVVHLARIGLINRATLVKRYEEELRPYLSGKTPTWNDSTLKMWVEACWP
jgi:hypothetical protein